MSFAEIGRKAADIHERTARALRESGREDVRALAGNLPPLGAEGQTELLRLMGNLKIQVIEAR